MFQAKTLCAAHVRELSKDSNLILLFNWYPPRIHYISTDHTFTFDLYYCIHNIMGGKDTSLVDMHTISNTVDMVYIIPHFPFTWLS